MPQPDFGGLAWLFLVSATSALAFARLYLVRGRGGTSGGAPAGPTPGADLSLPLIPSRYCRAPPFCCGFCVLVLRHGAAPPLQPCPVCPLLVPLCAWLRCPACYSSARARQLASLSVAADGAAPVRPSARGRSARLQSLSPSSYGKLDAPASPTATTHYTPPLYSRLTPPAARHECNTCQTIPALIDSWSLPYHRQLPCSAVARA